MQLRQTAADKLKSMRTVPQSYDETGELINVRALLRAGRPDEALERLTHAMDRYRPNWRARGL